MKVDGRLPSMFSEHRIIVPQGVGRRDIVFVHIPKTGGTSLRNMLRVAVPEALFLTDYGGSPEASPEVRELIYGRQALERLRARFDDSHRGIILAGHFRASRYWNSFDAESFVTLIRNPVDRVLSDYNHAVAHYGYTISLREFAQAEERRNVIFKSLADIDLDRFGFIGMMEDFAAATNCLAKFIGAKLPIRYDNVGDYERTNPTSCFDPSIRAMIAEFNPDDMEIYEKIRRERQESPLAVNAYAVA